jgi:hypothetical protein
LLWERLDACNIGIKNDSRNESRIGKNKYMLESLLSIGFLFGFLFVVALIVAEYAMQALVIS